MDNVFNLRLLCVKLWWIAVCLLVLLGVINTLRVFILFPCRFANVFIRKCMIISCVVCHCSMKKLSPGMIWFSLSLLFLGMSNEKNGEGGSKASGFLFFFAESILIFTANLRTFLGSKSLARPICPLKTHPLLHNFLIRTGLLSLLLK